MTPYITGTGAFKRPFESYYDDPVYDVHDADDDGQIDNPGDVLYYMPTRTNQTDNYNLSIGVSATWSKPLDKELQALCKEASTTQISLQKQLVANKRLDFEIARLKNCGELMKQGIMFHRKSPYYKVCADVVLVNPAGVVAQHTHQIKPQPQPEPEPVATGTAEDLGTHSVGTTSSPSSKVSSSSQNSQEVNPSSSDTHSSEVQIESADKESSQGWFGSWSWPFSRRASQPSSEDQPAALLGGPIQLPPSQSPQ